MSDLLLALVAAHPEPSLAAVAVTAIAGRVLRQKKRRKALYGLVAAVFTVGWGIRQRGRTPARPTLPASPQPKLERPTTLYRYYDADMRLLYVGITCRGAKRAAEHAKKQPWWPRQKWMRSEHYDTWAEAEESERVAIAKENPECNDQRWEPRRGRRAS